MSVRQAYSAQGLKFCGYGAKSCTLRVTTVRPWHWALAMSKPFITGMDCPANSAQAVICAQTCCAAASSGRMRPAKRCSTVSSEAVSFWLRVAGAQLENAFFNLAQRDDAEVQAGFALFVQPGEITLAAGAFRAYSEIAQVSSSQLLARCRVLCRGCGKLSPNK
jgi:hypothetical protein